MTPSDTSPNGGIFGYQAGYNWQWSPVVVGGIEIDFTGADIRGTSAFATSFLGASVPATHDLKFDDLASVRARLGYLIWPNLLAYGTAGIGGSHFQTTTSIFGVSGGLVASSLSSVSPLGWVAGGGLEWKFANRWLLRGEWLHYDFGTVTDPTDNLILTAVFISNGNSRGHGRCRSGRTELQVLIRTRVTPYPTSTPAAGASRMKIAGTSIPSRKEALEHRKGASQVPAEA